MDPGGIPPGGGGPNCWRGAELWSQFRELNGIGTTVSCPERANFELGPPVSNAFRTAVTLPTYDFFIKGEPWQNRPIVEKIRLFRQ